MKLLVPEDARFAVSDTPLGGLKVLQRQPRIDQRGFLDRCFCLDELHDLMGDRTIVQINRTLTEKAGAVRGMHYQKAPHAELKLVTCLRGEVFDVAVDLRAGSPTFLQWHSVVLSADNFKTLVIPEGFAHGFQALTPGCELLYLHTAAYARAAEGGVSPRDPRLAIAWPQPITELSERDAGHPLIGPEFDGLIA